MESLFKKIKRVSKLKRSIDMKFDNLRDLKACGTVCSVMLMLAFQGYQAAVFAMEKNVEKLPATSTPAKPMDSQYKIHGITVEDVVTGTGKMAKKGDTVAVHYRGTLVSNGEQFDSSYDRNRAFTFKLGGGQVIEGWDKGLAGMKEGGKRVLIIPPEKGYGEMGSPPVIPGNATLKFEVELLSVQD
jgi:FKBP-type peptidyl-prolyl cis-trans isomerase FkpA